jgi:tagatose 1,6-diphosphate aldolase
MMELSAGKLWGLRRLADAHGRFKMVAVDQRPPVKHLIVDRRGGGPASYEDVATVKSLLVEGLHREASALLLDPHFAYPTAIQHVPASKGLLLTLEDSVFTETPGGRLSAPIDGWSVGKIKRAGGDAVKVLAWYRPDVSAEVRDHQEEFVARIGDACRRYDIPYLLELLVHPLGEDATPVADHGEAVLRSVETFAHPRFGVDVFKLESPVAPGEIPDPDGDAAAAARAQALFDELGRLAGRPWVMLSAGASAADFHRVCAYSYRAGASGYLAGRAIWWDALQAFPDLAAVREGLATEAVAYMRSLNDLTDATALPWFQHAAFGDDGPVLAGAGPDFRHGYHESEAALT